MEYLTIKYKPTKNVFKLPKDKVLEIISKDKNYDYEVLDKGFDRKIVAADNKTAYEKIVLEPTQPTESIQPTEPTQPTEQTELLYWKNKFVEITKSGLIEEKNIAEIKSDIEMFLNNEFSNLEVKELKELCLKKNIPFNTNTSKKVLIEKLIEDELKG